MEALKINLISEENYKRKRHDEEVLASGFGHLPCTINLLPWSDIRKMYHKKGTVGEAFQILRKHIVKFNRKTLTF